MKCTNCFEWSMTRPCEHCGASMPDEPPKTEEQIADKVFDRLRGSPKKKMAALANNYQMSYDDLMQKLKEYVESDGGEGIYLDVDIDYGTEGDMWMWYELITGEVVPHKLRDNPFSCSC
jgi:hypothetical protein